MLSGRPVRKTAAIAAAEKRQLARRCRRCIVKNVTRSTGPGIGLYGDWAAAGTPQSDLHDSPSSMGVSRPPDISPLSQLLRRIDGLADGAPAGDTVPTGFGTVDKMLGGGLRTGDLVVLGGDVGSGKSALALGIAMRAAMRGSVVRYYSGEMAPERVYERMLAIEGRARIDDLRHGALDDATRAGVA